MQTAYFKEKCRLFDVVSHPAFAKSLILGWFEKNKWDKDGSDLTYLEYPLEYRWDKRASAWIRRHPTSPKSIGCLVYIHPSSGELFYLRLLLAHQKGYQSFIDVRTVYGVIYPNFRAACHALGITGDDREWMTAFIEASEWRTSSQLRSLFSQLLLLCDLADPMSLWEAGWHKISEDLSYNIQKEVSSPVCCITDAVLQQHLLFELEKLLQSSTPSRSIIDFHLPMPSTEILTLLENRLLLEEKCYDRQVLKTQHDLMVSQLNTDQFDVYNSVVSAHNANKQVLLFIYGHGGTGKTFLWKTLLPYFRSICKIALAVSASGIASLLLPSGRTAHS